MLIAASFVPCTCLVCNLYGSCGCVCVFSCSFCLLTEVIELDTGDTDSDLEVSVQGLSDKVLAEEMHGEVSRPLCWCFPNKHLCLPCSLLLRNTLKNKSFCTWNKHISGQAQRTLMSRISKNTHVSVVSTTCSQCNAECVLLLF